MFSKVCVLGEGAYGTVYKVKCLKTSIISGGSEGTRIVLDPQNKKITAQLKKPQLGVNVTSTLKR